MGLCVFCCASVIVRWCNAYYFRNQWWDLCSYQVYIRVHTHKMYMYMPFSCQKTRLALHLLCLCVCFVCPSGLRETELSLSFFFPHYIRVKILQLVFIFWFCNQNITCIPWSLYGYLLDYNLISTVNFFKPQKFCNTQFSSMILFPETFCAKKNRGYCHVMNFF